MNASHTPNPVLSVLGQLLERVLNRVVRLDSETLTRLDALDGRAVTVEFRGTPLALRVCVQGTELRIGPAAGGDSALRVLTSPGSLLAMALRRGSGEAGVAPGTVEIAGDADLARRLEQIASRYRPDIEEAFTRTFGDVLGVPLATGFSNALRYARERGERLVQDTAEYLREESRDLVAPGEMDEFLDAVDRLRERGERLEARLNRLAAARVPRA
ncbi:ubiquinone biosynthesis accessory factor UbiJ [Tahibacter amnicola]|uniref:Ubiquinone biosynthesis accessory factor UbiJ n=1 Tax=Tahibacter amnicola TaxID=2976241 RepID=A0ABY6BID4_9GAMM|nr:SCP2 sterol-binding domain-containing protein [Tahibacter amnicola]UXI68381.1 sterol-binding protein [Tahibacter amnicola]